MSPRPSAALLAAALLAASPASAEPDLAAALQARFDGLREEMGFPGATLAVVLPSGEEHVLATGLADVVGEVAMRPFDRLMSGSIGKNFVAALALRLVEAGAIELDTPLIERMRGVDGFAAVPNAARITLRMLLEHTSGVPEWIDADVRARMQAEPTRAWTTGERLEALHGATPLFEAGAGFEYTDANYILAGIVIEAASGRTFESLVGELLEQQGLRDTEPSDELRLDGLVPGYSVALANYGLQDLAPEVDIGVRTARQVVTDHTHVFNPQVEWTGGGLVTTSADLARWAHRLFAGEVLAPESLATMTTNPRDLGYPGYEYAMGLEVSRSELGVGYGHSGFFPGYLSDVLHFPDHGFSIATQVNCDDYELANTRHILLAVGELLAATR